MCLQLPFHSKVTSVPFTPPGTAAEVAVRDDSFGINVLCALAALIMAAVLFPAVSQSEFDLLMREFLNRVREALEEEGRGCENRFDRPQCRRSDRTQQRRQS